MAQSVRNSHFKNLGGKNKATESGTYTKKEYGEPSEQLFPNKRSLTYPNLTKNENVHKVQTTQNSTPKH